MTREDGEVRSFGDADLSPFRPINDVDPGMIDAIRRARGRPAAQNPKVHIGFRLDADVVAGIRATGRGYNKRVETVLRDALSKGKL